MKVLAENGADIFCANEKGENVMHIAAKKKYCNIAKMLVKSHFPLDNQTKLGQTSMMIAAKKGNLSVLKILIRAGASINLTD